MQNIDKVSRELLNTALRYADSIESSFQQIAFHPAGDPAKAAYVFLFSKMLRTFRAFAHLVMEGFTQEAEILTRCNFEALVDWRYIQQDPEERGKRWMLYLNVWRSKQLRALRQLDEHRGRAPLEVPSSILTELGQAEDEFRELYKIRDFSKVKNWAGLSIRSRAEGVGLLEYYLVAYNLQSDIVHCGPSSIASCLDFTDTDVLGMRAQPTWSNVSDVLSLGCALLGLCIEQAGKSFGLDCDSLVADFGASVAVYQSPP